MRRLVTGNSVHQAFRASLLLKGAFAASEIATGILASLIPPGFLLHLVKALTRAELAEDPLDHLAIHLLRAAQGYTVGSQHFVAFYLLSHGVVKLWLILGLWRGRRAYYPAAMGVFGLFIVYQAYRFHFTHSIPLLLITLVDGVMIWLTWVEYRNLGGGNHTLTW
jgi:uncharacterized membrane protein